jgi:spermidine synthase
MTFFEIDPEVVTLAQKHFSFLRWASSRCSRVDVLRGDGRVALRNEGRTFDVIVGDAFSSDAIPVHMLTIEAIADMESKLSRNGLLALHISNRTFNLAPLIARAASLRRLGWIVVSDKGDSQRSGSNWVFVSPDHSIVDRLRHALTDGTMVGKPITETLLNPRRITAWRDQRLDLLSALR